MVIEIEIGRMLLSLCQELAKQDNMTLSEYVQMAILAQVIRDRLQRADSYDYRKQVDIITQLDQELTEFYHGIEPSSIKSDRLEPIGTSLVPNGQVSK